MIVQTKDRYLIDLLSSILSKGIDVDYYTEFAPVFGQKLLSHANSLNLLIKNSIDLSSIVLIARGELETYVTFFFLFMKGSPEERFLRYKLWELDGLIERSKFSISGEDLAYEEKAKILEQQEYERIQIQCLKDEIPNLQYFEEIPPKYQRKIIERGSWKFSLEKMNRNDNRYEYSIGQMIDDSNIKKDYIEDIYSYFSMHSHSGHISILQNQQMTKEFFETPVKLMIDFSSILMTLFIEIYLDLFKLDISDYCDENHLYFTYQKRVNMPSRI